MFIPQVMIIGAGFMGSNHLKNLDELERQGKVKVVSVVDADTNQLKNIKIPTFANIEEAYLKTNPDIVSICTNTQTHDAVLNKILDLCERERKQVGIFIEKPLVANSQEAEKILARLKKMEYGSKYAFTCGYLFPYSPAFKKGVEELKNREFTIKKISTTWIKDRMPTRPTEGVHIDEATHPLDAILNKILRATGHMVNKVEIVTAEHRRETADHPICDRQKQEKLYAGNKNKLIPVVDVRYQMTACGIPIEGHSSFIQGPQKREIRVECEEGIFVFRFDEKNSDILEIQSDGNTETFVFENPNKLLLEWESFLEVFKTGAPTFETPTLEDMVFDVRLTEALELDEKAFPLEISHSV